MARIALVVLVFVSEAVAAEERCEEICAEEVMRPETRQEILAGIGLFAVGYTIGLLSQIPVHASPAEYVLVRPLPVFGAIEAAARAGDEWQARMSLAFSAGVQIVGIILATTSYALRHQKPDKRVSLRTGSLTVHF